MRVYFCLNAKCVSKTAVCCHSHVGQSNKVTTPQEKGAALKSGVFLETSSLLLSYLAKVKSQETHFCLLSPRNSFVPFLKKYIVSIFLLSLAGSGQRTPHDRDGGYSACCSPCSQSSVGGMAGCVVSAGAAGALSKALKMSSALCIMVSWSKPRLATSSG